MRATYGATEYGKVGIESVVSGADPHQLISVLFSQLKKELIAAEFHCKAENFDDFRSKITKANRILIGLQGSLDFNGGGDLADNLGDLYGFCIRQLTKALKIKDALLIADVSRVLEPVISGWDEISPTNE
ncbi:flagellar protein FliS [Luminiphilus sp.]|nr:flagellar protein FliS [Luminiphilus sp.]